MEKAADLRAGTRVLKSLEPEANLGIRLFQFESHTNLNRNTDNVPWLQNHHRRHASSAARHVQNSLHLAFSLATTILKVITDSPHDPTIFIIHLTLKVIHLCLVSGTNRSETVSRRDGSVDKNTCLRMRAWVFILDPYHLCQKLPWWHTPVVSEGTDSCGVHGQPA